MAVLSFLEDKPALAGTITEDEVFDVNEVISGMQRSEFLEAIEKDGVLHIEIPFVFFRTEQMLEETKELFMDIFDAMTFMKEYDVYEVFFIIKDVELKNLLLDVFMEKILGILSISIMHYYLNEKLDFKNLFLTLKDRPAFIMLPVPKNKSEIGNIVKEYGTIGKGKYKEIDIFELPEYI